MNRKEILEIRNQFTPEKAAIDTLCGCYVDHEKKKRFVTRKAFGQLSAEEEFKYHDIFRHTLSGTIGKNLLSLAFPLEQEAQGGAQEFLLSLRDSKLQDDELLDQFFDRIIASYVYEANYYIIVIHGAYDIPSKATDGMEMFDASEDVYDFILLSICPVNLAKAGLSYNLSDNDIKERVRDWVVDVPEKGFLFPAFTDRNTDIHSVLYYTKKPEDLQADMMERLFSSPIPLTAGAQKETFGMLISSLLGEECNYRSVANVHESLGEMIAEHKEDPEPLMIDDAAFHSLLAKSGISSEICAMAEDGFRAVAGKETKLLADNITNSRQYQIKTPEITIKVDPAYADRISTRIIDDRQCLVIPVDDHIEFNGIDVRTIGKDPSQS